MKAIITLLLAIPLIWARRATTTTTSEPDGRVCYRGAARVAFSEDDEDPTAYSARARTQTCESEDYGCGAVRKFGVSKQYDRENMQFIDDTGVAYSSLDLGCVRPAVCEAITGDENGACKFASYNYVRYAPQSCNATTNYDPEYYYRAVKLYYGCCTGDNRCVDNSRTSAGNTRAGLDSTCTENAALGNYLQDLQTCWQAGSEIFRRYFLCGDGVPVYRYRGACVNDYGEWSRLAAASDRQSTDCYYRRTCSARLITLMKTFADCACEAARNNSFSGRAITALMESNWNDYCPGIELSCNADRDYAPYIRRRLKKRRIKLRIRRAIADVIDTVKDTLREKMCQYLRRDCSDDEDEETVTVTVRAASDDDNDDGDDSRTRRLVDTADSDTQTDVYFDIYGDDGFDTGIDDAACASADILTAFGDDVTGGEAEVIYCPSDDAYIEEYGTDPDATEAPDTTDMASTPDEDTPQPTEKSDAFMIANVFTFIIAVFAYIMQ